jgi:hypothetical protein
MKKVDIIRKGLNDMIKTVKEKTNFHEGDLLNIVVNHNGYQELLILIIY